MTNKRDLIVLDEIFSEDVLKKMYIEEYLKEGFVLYDKDGNNQIKNILSEAVYSEHIKLEKNSINIFTQNSNFNLAGLSYIISNKASFELATDKEQINVWNIDEISNCSYVKIVNSDENKTTIVSASDIISLELTRCDTLFINPNFDIHWYLNKNTTVTPPRHFL